MNEYLIYLAKVHLNEPRNLDKNSEFFKSLDRLGKACSDAGLCHHLIMQQALIQLNSKL
jgi:hypothetical protein